jgi:hypothetical protein
VRTQERGIKADPIKITNSNLDKKRSVEEIDGTSSPNVIEQDTPVISNKKAKLSRSVPITSHHFKPLDRVESTPIRGRDALDRHLEKRGLSPIRDDDSFTQTFQASPSMGDKMIESFRLPKSTGQKLSGVVIEKKKRGLAQPLPEKKKNEFNNRDHFDIRLKWYELKLYRPDLFQTKIQKSHGATLTIAPGTQRLSFVDQATGDKHIWHFKDIIVTIKVCSILCPY